MTEQFMSRTQGWSSLDVARWHMKNSSLTGTSWSVALVIAMHHNKARGYAFPTIDKLVTDTPFSRRSIARAIQEMKDSGEWHITSGRGGPMSNSRVIARANRYYPLPKDESQVSLGEETDDSAVTDDQDSSAGSHPEGRDSTGTTQSDSEVPGWHLTIPVNTEESGARMAPHPEESGARVAPHSNKSGARVALHPPSEVPGWHPKREYILKESDTELPKGENHSLKEKNLGGGRSSSTSTLAEKAKRDRPSSLDSSSSKIKNENSKVESEASILRTVEPFYERVKSSLHQSQQKRFEKEWDASTPSKKQRLADELSHWNDKQFVWLASNSAASVKKKESIRSILGWVIKFGGVYEPHATKSRIDPDREATVADYENPL